MTVFSDAATWLHNKRLSHAVITITYERGIVSESFSSFIGRTRYETIDEFGMVVQDEARDYFIDITAFDATSLNVPEVGDIIKEDDGSEVFEYKVLAIPGSTHYNRDAHRLRYQIHTKRISEE